MKKVLAIACVGMFAFGLTSCKKDYTCECTYNGQVIASETAKMKKKDAEEWCEGSSSAGGATVTCSLK